MSLLKSKQTWITFICIGAGLFMLAALAHVAQASECGDLAHFIGQNCTSSSSGGWDPMAELDNMGTDKADQSSAPLGTNWAKVSRHYRWNTSDLGTSSSSYMLARIFPGKTHRKLLYSSVCAEYASKQGIPSAR